MGSPFRVLGSIQGVQDGIPRGSCTMSHLCILMYHHCISRISS